MRSAQLTIALVPSLSFLFPVFFLSFFLPGASVAVTDPYGVMKLVVSTPGMPPASVDQAMKKARTAAMFAKIPSSELLQWVQPGGPIYGIASSLDGLVAYSGLGALKNQQGVLLGGIGVFSEGTIDVDNAIAAAGVAAASTAAAQGPADGSATLSVPMFHSRRDIDPIGFPYAGAYVSAAQLWPACWAALSTQTTRSTCTARDGMGVVRVLAREDDAPQASIDMSMQISKSAFGFPHPSDAFQGGIAPGQMYFTASYAESVKKREFYTALPGGLPLVDPQLNTLIGSIGISSGLVSAQNDTAAARLAADTLLQLYPGNVLQQSTGFVCQNMVEMYNAHVNVGNFSGAAALTLTPNVKYTIPGPALAELCPVSERPTRGDFKE